MCCLLFNAFILQYLSHNLQVVRVWVAVTEKTQFTQKITFSHSAQWFSHFFDPALFKQKNMNGSGFQCAIESSFMLFWLWLMCLCEQAPVYIFYQALTRAVVSLLQDRESAHQPVGVMIISWGWILAKQKHGNCLKSKCMLSKVRQ